MWYRVPIRSAAIAIRPRSHAPRTALLGWLRVPARARPAELRALVERTTLQARELDKLDDADFDAVVRELRTELHRNGIVDRLRAQSLSP